MSFRTEVWKLTINRHSNWQIHCPNHSIVPVPIFGVLEALLPFTLGTFLTSPLVSSRSVLIFLVGDKHFYYPALLVWLMSPCIFQLDLVSIASNVASEDVLWQLECIISWCINVPVHDVSAFIAVTYVVYYVMDSASSRRLHGISPSQVRAICMRLLSS